MGIDMSEYLGKEIQSKNCLYICIFLGWKDFVSCANDIVDYHWNKHMRFVYSNAIIAIKSKRWLTLAVRIFPIYRLNILRMSSLFKKLISEKKCQTTFLYLSNNKYFFC